MVLIKVYRLVEQGDFFYVQSLETSHCPICELILLVRGTRQRGLIISDDEKQTLVIKRLYCQDCKRIHHELPDCIVPYKRYSADVIENIISDQGVAAPCPADTVRRILRWWAVVIAYFLHILQTLETKLGVSFGKPPAFREIVRAVANSHNWIFAHQVCTRSASNSE